MARSKKEDLSYLRERSGKWHFDIELKRPDGTTFRKTGEYKEKTKAIEKRDAALALFASGTKPDSHTLSSWADYCLEHIYPTATSRRKKPYSPNTIQGYRQIIDAYVRPTIGDVRLAALTHEHIDRMLAAIPRLTTGQKTRRMEDGDQTKINTKNVVSNLLEWAIKREKTDRNVCKGVSIARKRVTKLNGHVLATKRILTDQEADGLLTFARETWGYCAILLGLKIGLRIGEALGLTWAAVDFKRNVVDVLQQAQRITGLGYHLMDTKTDASIRTIPMPPSVRNALLEAKKTSPCDYVTSNSKGGMVEQNKLAELMRDLSDLAGLSDDSDCRGTPLPAPTFHDLRSTFCTNMAQKYKVAPGTLIKLSGHSDVKTLLDFYVKASDDDVLEAMAHVA